jgi:hypothetical protein
VNAIINQLSRVVPCCPDAELIRIVELTRMRLFLLMPSRRYARRHIGGRARTGSSSDQSPSSST